MRVLGAVASFVLSGVSLVYILRPLVRGLHTLAAPYRAIMNRSHSKSRSPLKAGRTDTAGPRPPHKWLPAPLDPDVPATQALLPVSSRAYLLHMTLHPPPRSLCPHSSLDRRIVAVHHTCAQFVAIEHVTCSTPFCGGLRRAGARVCNRCGQASPSRPSAVGDVIMGRLGASTGAVSDAGAEESGAPCRPISLTEFARSRPTPCSTSPRAVACADCRGRGSDEYSQLEEGHSKLLLSLVPPWLGTSSRGGQTRHALGGARLRGSAATGRGTPPADQARRRNAAAWTAPSLGLTELAGWLQLARHHRACLIHALF